MAPVEYMAGNLSGRQSLSYNGGNAFFAPDGKTPADEYQPRLIAAVKRRNLRRYFCVRTKSSTNSLCRPSMAYMGGAGAIYAAIVREKGSIYEQLLAAKPRGITLRAFIIRPTLTALHLKEPVITPAEGIVFANPWVNSTAPTVNVPQKVIDKFEEYLS